MIIEGEIIKLGNDIDTDVILPGKYLTLTDFHELGQHALEGIIPNFNTKTKQQTIIVAGENFGCGSSREHAPIALKYANVSGIIAASFARIFQRNAINVGLPVIECQEGFILLKDKEYVTIDLTKGVITDKNTGKELTFKPLPEFMLNTLKAGGLIPYLKKKIKQKSNI